LRDEIALSLFATVSAEVLLMTVTAAVGVTDDCFTREGGDSTVRPLAVAEDRQTGVVVCGEDKEGASDTFFLPFLISKKGSSIALLDASFR